jgi:hypothetical protein
MGLITSEAVARQLKADPELLGRANQPTRKVDKVIDYAQVMKRYQQPRRRA